MTTPATGPLSLAHSPCPNDTFIFHAWTHGLLPGAPPVTVTFADVDVTNTAAQRGRFDVVKVSYAALPWLLGEYALLPSGGALGRGCGPLVLVAPGVRQGGTAGVRQRGTAGARQRGTAGVRQRGTAGADPAALRGARVAVPGDRTTAYLLFRLWSKDIVPATVDVVPFEKIMPAVAEGRYDAGLVIHEARFTYPRYGLSCLVDLGEWWEADTGLPIPLGGILARRSLPVGRLAAVVRASVEYAWAHPTASAGYVAEHAQEMAPQVQRQHIGLYVNELTRDLGEEGYAAAETLLHRAAAAGLTPPCPALR